MAEIKRPETKFTSGREQPPLSWETTEYRYVEKSQDWWWLIGGGGFILFLLALIFGNFLGAVLVVIAGLAIALASRRPPGTIRVAILAKGIRVQNRLYPFSHLKSFWVEDDLPSGRKLIAETDSFLFPHLVILLADEIESESLRQRLRENLPEVKHESGIADAVSDALGF